jgi:hypothetical protein
MRLIPDSRGSRCDIAVGGEGQHHRSIARPSCVAPHGTAAVTSAGKRASIQRQTFQFRDIYDLRGPCRLLKSLVTSFPYANHPFSYLVMSRRRTGTVICALYWLRADHDASIERAAHADCHSRLLFVGALHGGTPLT